MLIERHTSKQKQLLLILAVVLMNAAVGYLVYRNFAPKRRSPSARTGLIVTTPLQVSENIAAIETLAVDFDRSLLDSEEFRMLEKYGSWPLEEAVTGRANPFLPAFGP